MFEQKRIKAESTPTFLRNAKGVEYSTGNITLDPTKFVASTVVEAGTAVHKNEDGYYEAVTPFVGEGEAPLLDNAMITAETVVVEDEEVHVSAITKGNVEEELVKGVTDQFKKSNGLIYFY